MDYSSIKIMSLMQSKMAYLAEKQDVLAKNIANADTPGFRPQKLRDVDFEDMAMKEAHRLQMRATSASHLGGTKPEHDFRMEKQRKTYETSPVKNAVAIEEQMAMVAQNNIEYSTITNLYKKTAGLFRTALGNR